MPDEAPQRSRKQTWMDWIPEGLPHPRDDELITREEIMARLAGVARSGYRDAADISERTLRYWEAQGILPGPIRRHHEGATRALYPEWMVNLVLYASGYTKTHVPIADRAAAVRDMVAPTIIANYIDDLPLMREHLPALLAELARVHQSLGNVTALRATVTLEGADGKPVAVHTISLQPTGRDESLAT